MKRQITILILVFTINLSAQIKNEYYENGQIKTTGNLKNDAKDGLWKQFYENGKLKNEGNYSNGKKTDEWKLYYENGKINAIGSYDKKGFPIAYSWKIYSKEGVVEKFDCPEPGTDAYKGVCVALTQQDDARNPEMGLSFSYQERLWKMSCAKPGIDSWEIATIKIQIMWNKYREKFRCHSPTVSLSGRNIAEFSLCIAFRLFLDEAVDKYQLDMNFIDPKDNKTILDHIQDEEKNIRNSPPVDTDKANEYQDVYQLLKANGAKHSWELNK